jgi:hypothetical protein
MRWGWEELGFRSNITVRRNKFKCSIAQRVIIVTIISFIFQSG